MVSQTVGNNLKKARLLKNLTQNDMASALNILQPAYARYESGKVQLNYELVEKVCSLLDVTPNFLWGYEDEDGIKLK